MKVVNLILPLEYNSQLTSCFSNVPQGEGFLSILLGVMEEDKEGDTKIKENKSQDAFLSSFVNTSNITSFLKADATLEFKHKDVIINTEENTPQKALVQEEGKVFVDHAEFIKLPEVKRYDLQGAVAFEKTEEYGEILSFKGDENNKVIVEEFRPAHKNTSSKDVEKLQVSSLDNLDRKEIESVIEYTKPTQFLKHIEVEYPYKESKGNQGTLNQKGDKETFIKAKEAEQVFIPKDLYLLESFKNSEYTSPRELLKPPQPFQRTQLDSKDIPLENQEVEQRPFQDNIVHSLTLEDKSQKDTLTSFKENVPTWEEYQKVKSVYKEEKPVDDIPFHNPLHKEGTMSIKQEGTKVESIKRQEFVISHEPRQINIKLEEAFLKLNLFGDRLRLSINFKEEVYRQPTEFEVQRLVQSLQSLGFNLEVLKLNGSMLYYSDQRQSKREDREKNFLGTIGEGTKVSKEEKKSFSLYL